MDPWLPFQLPTFPLPESSMCFRTPDLIELISTPGNVKHGYSLGTKFGHGEIPVLLLLLFFVFCFLFFSFVVT